jgi:Protein of unknown function (DUF3618)
VNDRVNDPAAIERDLAETRVRLSTHLDELIRRMSPGQLVDEGLGYLRNGQGAEFVRKLGADLRDNPLPVALTGLGVAWLAVVSSIRREHRTRALVPYEQARGWREVGDDIAERARRAGDAVSRGAAESDEAFRARVADARARVLGMQRDVAEAASAYIDRVQTALDAAQTRASETLERVGETGRQATEAVGDALRRSRDYVSTAGNGVAETVGNNPLLLAAFGVAAGALIGMMLPRTSQEDEWLGNAAGTLRETANDVMDRGTRAAEAAVAAGYEAARSDDAPGSRPA